MVAARMADPQRRTQTGTDRRHLGSGLYVCDVCGETIRAFVGGQYRCRDAHVNRARTQIDKYVIDVITERLTRPDFGALLAPDDPSVAPLLNETASSTRSDRGGGG